MNQIKDTKLRKLNAKIRTQGADLLDDNRPFIRRDLTTDLRKKLPIEEKNIIKQGRELINEAFTTNNPTFEEEYRWINIRNFITVINQYQDVYLYIKFFWDKTALEANNINLPEMEEFVMYKPTRNIKGVDNIDIDENLNVNTKLPEIHSIRWHIYNREVEPLYFTVKRATNLSAGQKYVFNRLTGIVIKNGYQEYLTRSIFRDDESKCCFYDSLIYILKNKYALKQETKRNLAIKRLLEMRNEEGVSINDTNFKKMISEYGFKIYIRNIFTSETIEFCDPKYKSKPVFVFNLLHTYQDHVIPDFDDKEEIKLTAEEFEKMKNESNDIIIVFGSTLIINDKVYKKETDPEFNDRFGKYKIMINEDNKDLRNFLNCYYHNMHHIFNNKLNYNDLVEFDLKKAYINIHDQPFYNGIPSKNMIFHKLENYTNEDFNKQYENNIIGFYHIRILNINDKRIKIFGFNNDKENGYILASIMIKWLIQYADIEFVAGAYSKSDMERLYTLNDVDMTKCSNKKEIPKYCKFNGLLQKEFTDDLITVKSDKKDDEFITTCCDKGYDVFKFKENEGKREYVLRKEKNTYAYTSYVAYYVHSYINYWILSTVMKMKDIKNLYGIKYDSIVCHKDEIDIFDSDNFSNKTMNIVLDKEKNIFLVKKGDKVVCESKTKKEADNYIKTKRENMEKIFGEDTFMFLSTVVSDEDYTKEEIEEIKKRHNVSFDLISYPKLTLPTDYLYKNIIYCTGKGGSGKTTNIISSLKNKIIYTTSSWNLCNDVNKKFGINAFPIHRLLGDIKGYECEPINITSYQVLIIDEITLLDIEHVKRLINKYSNMFIFVLGDVNSEKGRHFFFYQCSVSGLVYPFDDNIHQRMHYQTNFRFSNEYNDKLDKLRDYMLELVKMSKAKPEHITDKVLELFKDRVFDYKTLDYDNDTKGLTPLNEFTTHFKGEGLNKYYYNKNGIVRHYVNKTLFNKGLYKGMIKDEEIKGYTTNGLFLSVHGYQGITIPENEKLIINISHNFDYQLLYTALSRVKNESQIYLIHYDYKK